jgi:RNA polymerase sigma factor (sigma-70 family)
VKAVRTRTILGFLHQALPPDTSATDGQLLGRYVARRDDAAFAALVRRHGAMVLSVCRRILRHAQDAEDAFQAAFLILATKAARLGGRPAVAGWLHKVAYHAALEGRARRSRREALERRVEDMPHPITMPDESNDELLALLDRELARLPEKHRLPLVLCELEGRSRREAARQLGLAEGTLSSRLARGRKLLARRMAAHGAAVGAAALTALLAGAARAACVPGVLVVSTVGAASGAVPAGVAALAKGVMKAMFLSKLKCAAWILVVAALVGAGATAWVYRTTAAEPARPPASTAALPADPAARPDGPNRDDLEALRLEVEALRLELKATKERVKALEDQAQKARPGTGTTPPVPPGYGPPGALPSGPPGSGLPAVGPGAPPNVPPPPGSLPPGSPPGFPGSRAPGTGPLPPGPPASTPEPDLDAALKALKQNPDDKQALDALLRALRRQKEKDQETHFSNSP